MACFGGARVAARAYCDFIRTRREKATMSCRSVALIASMTVCALSNLALAQNLAVLSHFPARHTAAPHNGSVLINFDRAVNPATFTSANFKVWGRWSGRIPGTLEFLNGDTTVRFTPSRPYNAGEAVQVLLSRNVGAADGTFLRNQGYWYTYMIRAEGGTMQFEEIANFSNRDGTGAQTRIYGASAADLDGNGWMDIATVNEVSADVRIFMNRSDGSGMYQPMSVPYYDISFETSPNEPGDLNNDGITDLALASYAESEVNILIGNGDGTFDPAVVYPVGSTPAGLTLLDADGDGDLDIATGNVSASNVSLLKNNGNGTFQAAVNFEAGGNGEYQINAADMNEDGIPDLVVACIFSSQVAVLRGNGNGTFTAFGPPRATGGNSWALTVADVNGDGHMDATTGNSGSANASILLGNGAGGLGVATVYTTAGQTIASDLADFDNDGDMDWVISSFGGGRWFLFENNGAGVFALERTFIAPANPSCAVMVDLDNDLDVDMIQTDEIADVVILQRNMGTPTPCFADASGDGSIGLPDVAEIINNWGLQVPPGTRGDVSANVTVGLEDLAIVINGWGTVCP